MNLSAICLEQTVKLPTGSKYFCALPGKETSMRKRAAPLPALFAPNLHVSIVGGGTHTPNSRAHMKSEELTNEQGLRENECILRGKL